jgi:CO/xanthine dehydrogenase FAD-binding subunit
MLGTHADLRAELLGKEVHALLHAVGTGSPNSVRVLATIGFDLGLEGPWGGTALHHAAWHGRIEMVRALLAAGAPIHVRDKTYGSTPLAWAAHGSANCREADDDYIAVIDLLLEAGSIREPSFNKWNEPPESMASDAVADHLRLRGFAPEDKT